MRTSDSEKINQNKRSGIHWTFVLIPLLLLIGAGLRFFRIDNQSFWDDEIVTFTVSRMDIPVLWDLIGSIDFNPPFYYVVLHYWAKLGSGEFAYRSLSALLGVLAIGLTYLLGKQIAGKWTGIAGAALLTISPLTIYSCQETRYYQLLTCLCLASFYFLIRLLKEGQWYWTAGLAISSALLIYTHYYGFFFVAAILVYLLALSIRTVLLLNRSKPGLKWLFNVATYSRQEIIRWPATVSFLVFPLAAKKIFLNILRAVLALLIAGVVFVPFLKYFSAQVMRGMPGRDPVGFVSMIKKLLIYFFIGHSPVELPVLLKPFEWLFAANPDLHEWALIGLILPILVLAFLGFSTRASRYRGFLATTFIFPLLMIFFLSIWLPLFEPRYLAPFLPFVCITAGAGLARLFSKKRMLALAVCLYVLCLTGLSLGDYYFKPKFARQNWRNTALFIEKNLKPNDALAFYNYYTALPFNYYYKGETDIVYLFDYDDRYEAMDVRKNKLIGYMDRLEQDSDRVWLIDYHGSHDDPLDLTRKEFTKRGFKRDYLNCSLSGLYRFCVELYLPGDQNCFELYSSDIDFSSGVVNEAQLVKGFFPGSGAWRWIGKEALVKFEKPSVQYMVELEFFADIDLLGEKNASIRIDIDGETIDVMKIERSDVYKWQSKVLMPVDEEKKLKIRIISDRSFVPDEKFNDGDLAEKSILLKRISIALQEAGEGA